MQHKVTVIGGGNVGATAAQRLVEREIADVVPHRRRRGPAAGQGARHDGVGAGREVRRDDRRLEHATRRAPGSDIVVITAGLARKPGMSRDDLLHKNDGDRRRAVCREAFRHSRDAIFIVVSNPLDAMCEVVQPRHEASARAGDRHGRRSSIPPACAAFIAEALDVSVENTHAFVLGGHGDTMVPLPRYSTVAGIPITELLPAEKVDAIVKRTRNGGAEIVNFLKTGSAYYAPSSAVVEMVDAILRDKKKILPCAV